MVREAQQAMHTAKRDVTKMNESVKFIIQGIFMFILVYLDIFIILWLSASLSSLYISNFNIALQLSQLFITLIEYKFIRVLIAAIVPCLVYIYHIKQNRQSKLPKIAWIVLSIITTILLIWFFSIPWGGL